MLGAIQKEFTQNLKKRALANFKESIVFVDNKKVGKILFKKIINLTKEYKPTSDKSLHERRVIAEKLLKNLNFK